MLGGWPSPPLRLVYTYHGLVLGTLHFVIHLDRRPLARSRSRSRSRSRLRLLSRSRSLSRRLLPLPPAPMASRSLERRSRRFLRSERSFSRLLSAGEAGLRLRPMSLRFLLMRLYFLLPLPGNPWKSLIRSGLECREAGSPLLYSVPCIIWATHRRGLGRVNLNLKRVNKAYRGGTPKRNDKNVWRGSGGRTFSEASGGDTSIK